MGFMKKADFQLYQDADKHYEQVLGTRDFLALGVGTIISTSIFTLPGQVAAQFAGPGVVFSYLIAAVVAGFVAFAYAEMSTVMPLAGSAYSWISVLFGEGFGWIAGWALLAEYFIAVAFVGAGFSANFQQLLAPLGFHLPAVLANPFGTNGGVVDIISFLVILISALIVFRGASDAGKVSQVLVVLKVAAVIAFIIVGITAIHPSNYHPFIPPHNPKTGFGGFSGIWSGVSMIFLAYIGFDSIAANSAEAKNPKKTMPRGILGSLFIAVALFAAVTLVLVGMHRYSAYEGNAAPVGWALQQSGYSVLSEVVTIIALAGMFVALLGMVLAGSRLIYAFGRDGLLPKGLGKMNKKHLPANGVWALSIVAIVIGAFFPFAFLAQLISAGTLIAFMFVSLGIYSLRRREGKDLPKAAYKMPFYPVLPALGFIGSAFIFWDLDANAKIYAGLWFLVGLVIYFFYGRRNSKNLETEKSKENIKGVGTLN
ncbi:APC family permease [Lactococcus protaetiae]|uniref:Amino acid permease n=1 Tax=Lactococcus protaetiae TaxID=2592653 RepID=A0A514Z703_9LACT|nr:amino acid permease [Lactococcus protaetiae]MCL2112447.1 amino acid permease [Streptococcaceae bacterium]QDK70361.1 amino acid permease [Lactococcus protaetiae]